MEVNRLGLRFMEVRIETFGSIWKSIPKLKNVDGRLSESKRNGILFKLKKWKSEVDGSGRRRSDMDLQEVYEIWDACICLWKVVNFPEVGCGN